MRNFAFCSELLGDVDDEFGFGAGDEDGWGDGEGEVAPGGFTDEVLDGDAVGDALCPFFGEVGKGMLDWNLGVAAIEI